MNHEVTIYAMHLWRADGRVPVFIRDDHMGSKTIFGKKGLNIIPETRS
jgi:hypothetical protein